MLFLLDFPFQFSDRYPFFEDSVNKPFLFFFALERCENPSVALGQLSVAHQVLNPIGKLQKPDKVGDRAPVETDFFARSSWV